LLDSLLQEYTAEQMQHAMHEKPVFAVQIMIRSSNIKTLPTI